MKKRYEIINLRKSKSLTQQAVADKAGISRSYYAMVEIGSRGCSIKTWLKLGEVLGMPKNRIFDLIMSESEKSNE